jgi:hypothetical protein
MVSVIACALMFVFAMICIIIIILSILFDEVENIYMIAYYLSMTCGLIALFAIPWAIG